MSMDTGSNAAPSLQSTLHVCMHANMAAVKIAEEQRSHRWPIITLKDIAHVSRHMKI